MIGFDATRKTFVPVAKRHFAVLIRSEPLAEPNVLDTFFQLSIVKMKDFQLFPFYCYLPFDELEEL